MMGSVWPLPFSEKSTAFATSVSLIPRSAAFSRSTTTLTSG